MRLTLVNEFPIETPNEKYSMVNFGFQKVEKCSNCNSYDYNSCSKIDNVIKTCSNCDCD
jgi:hypothetical protein